MLSCTPTISLVALTQLLFTPASALGTVLQTNLTWLDLSFNHIPAIQGLEQLTKLQDVSLFHNQISQLQGLDTLTNLNVLSIGVYQHISSRG